MGEKIGFTIGKFAPLHRGHQLVLETGLREMDRFIVVVYETDCTDIPVQKRADWIKELYPEIEIRFAYNPPSKYGLDEESVKVQMEYLSNIIKDVKVTHFYSSEPYGKCVADYLGIIDRRVDQERRMFPISAGKIRDNLEEYSDLVEDIVYKDLKNERR
ncbi:MAG: adenylyltransferase/cytidyltransferase family protein [Clostridia bacterium]|nr:adenylyltransferase/cytidyltransferase family protein [Clostridia bacterium]